MIPTEPPARPSLPHLDRRTILKGGLLGAGLAASPLAAQGLERGFTSGVASGEPGPDAVLLWTRYAGAQDVRLDWELAESLDFAKPVTGGTVTARGEHDWCVKPRAAGLRPGTWYYYRFTAPDGSQSEIGRTRTLPQGKTDRFRMAVFSCSNIGFGWFNAYAHAAAAGDFDCAFHLGDYFYEYAPDHYPVLSETLPGREVQPRHELIALADYRARYAQYRYDADLRRLHQLYPMIAVWDDHESANDSWKGGAENHQPDTEGPWNARKTAAMRAYREWMPVSDEPWAEYEIGDLATLFRLETRLTARSKQLNLADAFKGKATPEQMIAGLKTFRDETWRDPSREMLGASQRAWLADGMKRSTASGRPWQVLVQQVVMGTLMTPAGLAKAADASTPDYVRKRLDAGALATMAGLPFNMDAWDGYPAARDRLFDAALAAEANLISLAGDSHNAWGSNLAKGGDAVGVEFAGQSVTSPGFETYLPGMAPDALAKMLTDQNKGLLFADTSRRGYMAVELTPGSATCEWRFLSGVRQRSATLAGTHRMATAPGARRYVEA